MSMPFTIAMTIRWCMENMFLPKARTNRSTCQLTCPSTVITSITLELISLYAELSWCRYDPLVYLYGNIIRIGHFFVYSIFIILQQKRYSELQKDFINNMTHEFKTPISSINISADVLASPNIIEQPQRLKSYSAIIKQENQRLNNLVEKVLQIAHIEKGGYELKKEAIQLNNLITEVVENHQRQCANGRSITFTVQLSPEIKEVLADKLHLTNIIYNLLDNAVKYSGVVPQVTVTTSMNRDKIRLIVSDNGPGIDTEYQKKIFQKFFRIPTGNVHNVKGFGLGLYYVLKVCEAHGWKLYLESKVGKGSDFIIEMI